MTEGQDPELTRALAKYQYKQARFPLITGLLGIVTPPLTSGVIAGALVYDGQPAMATVTAVFIAIGWAARGFSGRSGV